MHWARDKIHVANVEPHRGGFSFGLGVAVRTNEGLSRVRGNPGEFTWNGTYGSQFFCDPRERLVAIVGTAAPGEQRKYYREQVQDIVYGAMVRSRGSLTCQTHQLMVSTWPGITIQQQFACADEQIEWAVVLAHNRCWHGPEIRAAAATESGIGGEPDAPERDLGGRGDSRI
jgi:hypothetical protein